MKILEWVGEIGWELSSAMVSQDLRDAKGDDITVDFSSPGGSIGVGGDIYLSLVKYRRDNPKAKMILRLGSMAASYGSLIAASPVWDNIKASDISMAMYHNPANFAYGDYQVMEDNSIFLKDARGMYVNIYSSRSGMSDNDTMVMMDKTTWLMGGQAIIDAGFADELITTESDDSDMTMLADQAKTAFKATMAKMSSEAQKSEKPFDYSIAMANMSAIRTTLKTETPGKPDANKKPAPVGNLKTEVPMTKEELKKDNPDLYESIMKDGAGSEREKNIERVKALTEMKAKDEYKAIPEVVAVIDKCIEDGTEMAATQPLIMAAMMKIMADPARMATLESPGDIDGGVTPAPEMKVKKSAEV